MADISIKSLCLSHFLCHWCSYAGAKYSGGIIKKHVCIKTRLYYIHTASKSLP